MASSTCSVLEKYKYPKLSGENCHLCRIHPTPHEICNRVVFSDLAGNLGLKEMYGADVDYF